MTIAIPVSATRPDATDGPVAAERQASPEVVDRADMTVAASKRSARGRLLRVFSGSIASQAVLSATNFIVGILLLRRHNDEDYGLYTLAFTGTLWLLAVQGALFSGPMVIRAPKILDDATRHGWMASLLRIQTMAWLLVGGLIALGFAVIGPHFGWPAVNNRVGMVVGLSTAALAARDYIRQSLLLHSLSHWLVVADIIYAAMLLGSVGVFFHNPAPVPWIIGSTGVGAALSAGLGWLILARHGAWHGPRVPGVFKQVWSLGIWGVLGTSIAWLHQQGPYYLLAAKINKAEIAPVYAARQFWMPMFLVVGGIAAQLLPMASRWMAADGARNMIARVNRVAMGLAAMTVVYCGVLWLSHGLIETYVLKRNLKDLDTFMLYWGVIFLSLNYRYTLINSLYALERLRDLFWFGVLTAAVSFTGAWIGITLFGVKGCMTGMMMGEVIDFVVTTAMVWRVYKSLPVDAVATIQGDGTTHGAREIATSAPHEPGGATSPMPIESVDALAGGTSLVYGARGRSFHCAMATDAMASGAVYDIFQPGGVTPAALAYLQASATPDIPDDDSMATGLPEPPPGEPDPALEVAAARVATGQTQPPAAGQG